MEDRLHRLECAHNRLVRELRWVKAYAAVLSVVVVAGSLLAMQEVSHGPAILRAKGLIIEDDAGRERILLGAPIPAAKNRVRTDLERVRKLWAKRFGNGEKYMQDYAQYQHDTNGLLILDANGIDRIALGDPAPDPNIGKRIAPATGLGINDEQGFERTGYGLLNVGGQHRIVLGLDSAEGNEGVALTLRDGGPSGLMVRRGEDELFIGDSRDNEVKDEHGEWRLGTLWRSAGLVIRTLTSEDG